MLSDKWTPYLTREPGFFNVTDNTTFLVKRGFTAQEFSDLSKELADTPEITTIKIIKAIPSPAMPSFISLLEKNATISHLYFDKLKLDGVNAMLQALKGNTTITRLTFDTTNETLDPNPITALKELLEDTTGITSIHFDNYPVTSDKLAALFRTKPHISYTLSTTFTQDTPILTHQKGITRTRNRRAQLTLEDPVVKPLPPQTPSPIARPSSVPHPTMQMQQSVMPSAYRPPTYQAPMPTAWSMQPLYQPSRAPMPGVPAAHVLPSPFLAPSPIMPQPYPARAHDPFRSHTMPTGFPENRVVMPSIDVHAAEKTPIQMSIEKLQSHQEYDIPKPEVLRLLVNGPLAEEIREGFIKKMLPVAQRMQREAAHLPSYFIPSYALLKFACAVKKALADKTHTIEHFQRMLADDEGCVARINSLFPPSNREEANAYSSHQVWVEALKGCAIESSQPQITSRWNDIYLNRVDLVDLDPTPPLPSAPLPLPTSLSSTHATASHAVASAAEDAGKSANSLGKRKAVSHSQRELEKRSRYTSHSLRTEGEWTTRVTSPPSSPGSPAI